MIKSLRTLTMKCRVILTLLGFLLLLSPTSKAQIVILQQGFDSTSGSHDNGTWTTATQIQNGGNAWSSSGTGNDVIEGNKSCSGWSTCNDKTGNTYGITGGAPTFNGTGTNIGYTGTNSTYFTIFDDYDATSGSYGGIYTPTFNISGYTSATLTFYYNNANTDDSYIQVQYWNGSSWIVVGNTGEGRGTLGWHEATMSIPSTATEIVFLVISDYEYYAIGIDQVELYAIPPCTLSASVSSHTNVSPCSISTNGAATVTASSGTTPYTYSWTPSTGLTGATTASASGMGEGTYTCTVTDHNGCVQTPTITIGGPTAVTGSISSQTNVSCNGGSTGSATITASGGTSPYTYSWSSGKGTNTTASSLSVGTYTCTISDEHNCTGTVVVTITQPSLLRDSISSSTNIVCHGASTGSATVGVKGGTTPYTYSWSPSGGTNATASTLAAGSYTVTVTDHNSCTATATVTITQPTYGIRDSISSKTNLSCYEENNGSATVGVKYGTTPYTYSWSPSGGTHATANSLAAGTYTVTVTDHNGCNITAVATITQPAEFEGTINTYNICGSGTGQIGIDLTGGTQPYTYSWSPNISTKDTAYGLASGTSYTVTVNDANGCGPLVGNTTIETITAETVTVTSSTNESCYGGNSGSATASASPTHAYVWEPGGSITATISSLAAGTYTVIATETDGCTDTAKVTITQPTAISPIITYTNVCSGSSNGKATVSVSGGTSPYTYSWNTSPVQTTATANSIPVGNYTVTVTDHNSCVTTATVTIGSNSLPTLTVTPSSASLCIGSSDSLKVSGASTYVWTPSTGLSGTTGSAVNANPSSTETYTITGTASSGCTNTKTVVVTVNALPTLTITPSSATICSGNSASLTASGASTYIWSPNTNLSASTGVTVSANPTVATTYTVTGTNSNGCVNTNTVAVSINTLPTVSVTETNSLVCAGSPDTLRASGATTYSWSPSTGLSITTGATIVAHPAITTTYTVTGTNASGCSNTATETITVDAPKVNPDSAFAVYLATGTVTATGGTPPYSYSWSPYPPYPFLLPDTAAPFVLTVTDANGCASVDTANYVPTPNTAGPCGSIFISEYIQDTLHHDDAIELYNPTASTINLTNYFLGGSINGFYSNTFFAIQLTGTIAAHSTFLIANAHADTALRNKANMVSDTLDFGGQDLVALANIVPSLSSAKFTLLDVVGTTNTLPADTGWAVGTGSTENHTLVRQSSVEQGDPNWTTCQSQWNVYPRGTFSYIGHYVNICTPIDPHLKLQLDSISTDCRAGVFIFDIQAAADSPTYLNSCVIDLYLPPAEYISDNVTNGGVQVTRIGSFATGTDYNNFSVTSISGDSIIEIKLGDVGDTVITDEVQLGVTWVSMLRVQLQIQGCQYAPVTFIDTSVTTSTGYFTIGDSVQQIGTKTVPDTICRNCVSPCDSCDLFTTQECCLTDSLGNCIDSCTSSYYLSYCCSDSIGFKTIADTFYIQTGRNVNYLSTMYVNDSVSSGTCLPHIIDNTNPIVAGTNTKDVPSFHSTATLNSYTFIINGDGFGGTQGYIEMSNASDTGFVMLNSSDITFWSSTQIVVKTPGILIGHDGYPGSGPFKVFDLCGNLAVGNVQVNYSILNQDTIIGPNIYKLRPELVMDNDSTSITFLCDEGFFNNNGAMVCLKKAVETWNCYTGVNWAIADRDTTGDTIAVQDNKSIVAFSNDFPSPDAIGGAASWYLSNHCFDKTDQITFKREVDLVFRRDLPTGLTWSYDTSSTMLSAPDSLYFYPALLHELGHAIGLGHINDSSSLMYNQQLTRRGGSIDSGSTYPGPATYLGAMDMIYSSVAPSNKPSSLPGACNFKQLDTTKRECSILAVGIPTVTDNYTILNVYPNPSSGDITISYQLLKDANVEWKIIDITGRDIIDIPSIHKYVGNYIQQINLSNLADGVYFIGAIINGQYSTIKLIKI